MPFTVRRFDGVDEFIAATGEFLAAREAEHNLILGISSWFRQDREPVCDVDMYRFEADA